MLEDVLRGESGHVGRDLVHREPNVVESAPLLSVVHVGLVLLGHAHHHVALGRPAPRDLDVELRIHRGGLWNIVFLLDPNN